MASCYFLINFCPGKLAAAFENRSSTRNDQIGTTYLNIQNTGRVKLCTHLENFRAFHKKKTQRQVQLRARGCWPQLILVTTATTGSSVLFQAGILFSIENAKYWPILAHLGYFVANLRTFRCTLTGLNNAVVYQNGQI